MAGADAGRQRHALMLAVVPDRRVQHHLGDGGGQLRAVLAGDQRQHHVERRGAAGAGEAVAIDLEQAAGDVELGESLAEARQVLPMDGAAIAVEHPGLGQEMGAGAQRPDIGAAARRPAQPIDQPTIHMVLDVDAAADQHRRMLGDRLEIAIGHDLQAVRRLDRLAVGRMHGPDIELLLGLAVGKAQRLDRRGHRHHGEIGDENERDALRQRAGLIAKHVRLNSPRSV